MNCFLDMQGFRGDSNNLIIKELAFLFNENAERPKHYIFSPPCEFKSLSLNARINNLYIIRNLHKLNWKFGDVSINELPNILESIKNYAIFVKGSEKKKFIKNYCNNVFDLGDEEDFDLDCPSIAKLHKCDQFRYIPCPLNHSIINCAFHNCQLLKEWYSAQKHLSYEDYIG